ncbi:CpsD/CapB family tyrosine-protein kinase [Marimonas sp. MJW-29]|uniref:CpsD/CapB family tyrosine-protein kinase n=1 Tax=Sulfitobacter sediminis TaxID=3234186 RepID=A0ABV3RJT9_9RHOB
MAKNGQEDTMRDTYATDDLRTETAVTPARLSKLGMRHSIRPRRTLPARARSQVAEQAPEREEEAPLILTEEVKAKHSYMPQPDMPRWHELAMVQAGSRRSRGAAIPVVDADRDSASVRAFDLLRTRLRQTTQEHGWTNIAITAPTSGCGNTFTAVNLALSLSRIADSRTVLMDFNLRDPGVAKAFDITPRGSMQDFLAGRTAIGDHMVRVSETLALGLNDAPDHHSSETLLETETARTLERMRAAIQPELVIYDMPAMLAHDDVSAFLPQLDGVLLVSDGTQTMGRDLMECERMLDGQVPLLGVVLNRARADSVAQYA